MNTKRYIKKTAILIFCLALCYCVGFLGSIFTKSSVDSWYLTLNKPVWNPPKIIFPIIWNIIYAMIGISLWLVIIANKKKNKWVYLPFFIQLFLNFTWSFSFFYMRSPLLGLLNIAVLIPAIYWNIVVFYRYSKKAAFLLCPYFFWVLFAFSLNFFIWYMHI